MVDIAATQLHGAAVDAQSVGQQRGPGGLPRRHVRQDRLCPLPRPGAQVDAPVRQRQEVVAGNRHRPGRLVVVRRVQAKAPDGVRRLGRGPADDGRVGLARLYLACLVHDAQRDAFQRVDVRRVAPHAHGRLAVRQKQLAPVARGLPLPPRAVHAQHQQRLPRRVVHAFHQHVAPGVPERGTVVDGALAQRAERADGAHQPVRFEQSRARGRAGLPERSHY